MLGCSENALGPGDSLGDGRELVSTTEREGEGLLGDLRDADGLIATPFRYAAGMRESLMNFIQDRPIRDDYVMVSDGEIQSGSYKAIYG